MCSSDLVRSATDAIAGKDLATDKDACDLASNWATRLTELAKEADEARETEKRPHLDAGRAIDARWTPLRDRAKAEARKLKDRVGEALKARRTAAEASGFDAPTKAGTRGKVVSLRKVERLVITDITALTAFLAAMDPPPPDFVEVVRKLADRMRRAGVNVPGTAIQIEETAA